MPNPLFDLLSGSARAALPFIEHLAAQKLSANAIIDTLQQEYGLGFQRAAALKVINAVKNKGDPAAWVKIAGENSPIPDEYHQISPTRMDVNYRYRIELQNSPDTFPDFTYVSSDVPLSANDIFSVAGTNIQEGGGSNPDNVDTSGITMILDDARYSPQSTQASNAGF